MTTYQGSPRKGHRRSGTFQLSRNSKTLTSPYNNQNDEMSKYFDSRVQLRPHQLPMKNNTPYKLKSAVNDNRSQVRFSIPDPSQQEEDDDRSYISISNSPQKIVFPREADDSVVIENDNQSSVYSSRIVSSDSNNPLHSNNTRSLKKKLNLVDLQSKVMVDVPADIWKYHKHHIGANSSLIEPPAQTSHRKTQSMHAISNPYKENYTNESDLGSTQNEEWKPSHNRSKSLQSIIAETVKAYNNDSPGHQNENVSQSSFNETVSTISPLNIQQTARDAKFSKKHDLFLTSESPLNKYKVSVPLEINLPPYLSPQNKQKNLKRNSLVYDGNGYSVYDEGMDPPFVENEHEPSEESTSILESLLGEDSLPYADNEVSIDVGEKSTADADKFLGIDQDANVNLKLQYRNIRDKSAPLPSLPDIPREKEIPAVIVHPPKRESQLLSPQRPESNENKALEILATPSKNIVIPNLEDETYQTPKNPSTSGSLQFFDKFEPLANNQSDKDSTTTQSGKSQGELNMSFKFPYNSTGNAATTIDTSNPIDDDFVKIAPPSADRMFETRRQRLLQNQSTASSPVHKMGHAHRRTKSVHNIDFAALATGIEKKDLLDATSTPPRIGNKPSCPPSLYMPDIPSTDQTHTPSVTLSPPMDKTEESIVLLSERVLSPVAKTDSPSNVRPLSSFQSFNNPVTERTVDAIRSHGTIDISKEMAENRTLPNNIFNTLSPRRILSNNGSTQSSSVTSYTNSQFSRNSYNTNSTDVIEIEQEYLPELLKKGNHYNQPVSPPEDVDVSQDQSLEIIKEVKNGKEVEVIILDDSDTDQQFKPKKTKPKRQLRASRKQTYDSLLTMCDDTASQAKDIIYRLVSETDPLSVDETSEKSPIIPKNIGTPDNQRDRYLKKFNRTIKVKPSK